MIRVLLADDQALVRAGFRMLLESADDITIVGEAANGGRAVAFARELRPDVVLMDLSMPEVDGLTATRRITADPELASVKVVVLTTFDDDEHVFGALRAGAYGFLVKDVEPAELLQGVRVVARGDALLAPSVTLLRRAAPIRAANRDSGDRAERPGGNARRHRPGSPGAPARAPIPIRRRRISGPSPGLRGSFRRPFRALRSGAGLRPGNGEDGIPRAAAKRHFRRAGGLRPGSSGASAECRR